MINSLSISGITGSTPIAKKIKIFHMFEGMEVNGWTEIVNTTISNNRVNRDYSTVSVAEGRGDRFKICLYDSNDTLFAEHIYTLV